MKLIASERGFTLVEILVASMVTVIVLGGAVAITSQVQASYTRQIEDAAAEQEGRYALEWVSRMIRAAGNNPYGLPNINDNGTPLDATDDLAIPPDCPPNDAAFPWITPVYSWLVIDPNGDGTNDDIRIQTDSDPPDGWLGGSPAGCNQANEDVTVSYDAATHSITFRDNNLGGASTIRTDAVIDGLNFVYRDAAHAVTANAANTVYVETQVTVRTRTVDSLTGVPSTRLLTQEVRIRGRNY